MAAIRLQRTSILQRLAVAFLLSAFALVPAHAQATRTWISGVGDDANPCSRTAPCKTFSGAMPKTAANGIIDVLDPGDFGSVTITKSITLESVGQVAGIQNSSGDGIDIAGAGIIVILRGLAIDGDLTGVVGINFSNGSQLILEQCDVGAFGGGAGSAGIVFKPATAATLIIRNSTIHGNGVTTSTDAGGILIQPATGGSAQLLLDNVRVIDNAGFGMRINGPGTVSLRNSAIAGNSGNGVWVLGGAGAVGVSATSVTVARNNQTGFLAQSGAQITLRSSVVTGNAQGVASSGSGSIVSYGNNGIYANVFDGAPDSIIAQH